MISENEAQNLVSTTSDQLPKVEKEAGKVVLKVEGLYKKFCRNLKRSMIYGMTDLAKGFVGIPPKTEELRKDEFWALQDINFELRENEILGIIGANGSGKSTLLRVLTGIFPPDKGSVWIDGKVGGIIALGAGMHPHMTGRENIYLNGTILGMTKQELDSKFNEIVDFAELGDFLEAPLSTYSSGMKVRLGFAVAVHCQPEILLVDEVLAVGDLSFQNKCLRKLKDLRETAKAVIFISHNMDHILNICDRAILMKESKISHDDDVNTVVNQYYYNSVLKEETPNIVNDLIKKYKHDYKQNELKILFEINCDSLDKNESYDFDIGILSHLSYPIIWKRILIEKEQLSNNKLKIVFKDLLLNDNMYNVNISVRNKRSREVLIRNYFLGSFSVKNKNGINNFEDKSIFEINSEVHFDY